jgi:hypothetical protein
VLGLAKRAGPTEDASNVRARRASCRQTLRIAIYIARLISAAVPAAIASSQATGTWPRCASLIRCVSC